MRPDVVAMMAAYGKAMTDAMRLGTSMINGTAQLSTIQDHDVRIATTPKDLVWSQDKVTLHHYRPLKPQRVKTPLLISYGLIGRWTMIDLQEDRSLVRNLLNLGIDIYVIDWGNPSRADRYLTMADYICGYLDRCVTEVSERAGTDTVNLFGLCQGGVFTTSYAALEPERINTMALAMTPIDFHADVVEGRPGHGLLNVWARSLDAADIERVIDANGNLPGEFIGALFNQLTPMATLLKYNLDMFKVTGDEAGLLNWLRMEKWISDRPNHPGAAAKQWVIDCYQQNKLYLNTLELDGRTVDLGRITMPVLNVFGVDDHIIPAATSRGLGHKVGTRDYEELALPGGHIGMFVGRRSQELFAPALADFLSRHDGVRAA